MLRSAIACSASSCCAFSGLNTWAKRRWSFRYSSTGVGFRIFVTEVTRIRRRRPVEDYLRPQRRYAHLFREPRDEAALVAIQAIADRNIARLGLLDELGPA